MKAAGCSADSDRRMKQKCAQLRPLGLDVLRCEMVNDLRRLAEGAAERGKASPIRWAAKVECKLRQMEPIDRK